jgi:hypothetical protein
MIVKIYLNNNTSSAKTMHYYTEGTSYYSFVVTSVGVIGGTSGTSGTGTSGTSGTGTSGTSGLSGTGSGTSGTSAVGTSGTSGTSGEGTSGTSGESYPKGSFGAVFDGSGGVITANSTAYVRVPYACTINNWEIVSTNVGTCAVDVYRTNTPPFSPFPPATAIFDGASSIPYLTAEQTRQNLSPVFDGPPGSNSMPAGTWFRFTIRNITTLSWVSVSIQVTKS